MTGYDSADGYRVEPLDDRDENDPEFTIDPILSYADNNGGDSLDRHRGLCPDGSYEAKSPAELAAMDPEKEASL